MAKGSWMAMYGRDEDTWERLTESAHAFLVERARSGRMTTYTEVNTALEQEGLRGFDFSQAADRAAMGHLLYRVVTQDFTETGLMLSALVRYVDANDAGAGFYKLAGDLGLLPRGASADDKMMFWVGHVDAVHKHYARPGRG